MTWQGTARTCTSCQGYSLYLLSHRFLLVLVHFLHVMLIDNKSKEEDNKIQI